MKKEDANVNVNINTKGGSKVGSFVAGAAVGAAAAGGAAYAAEGGTFDELKDKVSELLNPENGNDAVEDAKEVTPIVVDENKDTSAEDVVTVKEDAMTREEKLEAFINDMNQGNANEAEVNEREVKLENFINDKNQKAAEEVLVVAPEAEGNPVEDVAVATVEEGIAEDVVVAPEAEENPAEEVVVADVQENDEFDPINVGIDVQYDQEHDVVVAEVEVNDQKMTMVDVDGDGGAFDVALVDLNNDGIITEDEVFDLANDDLNVADLDINASNNMLDDDVDLACEGDDCMPEI